MMETETGGMQPQVRESETKKRKKDQVLKPPRDQVLKPPRERAQPSQCQTPGLQNQQRINRCYLCPQACAKLSQPRRFICSAPCHTQGDRLHLILHSLHRLVGRGLSARLGPESRPMGAVPKSLQLASTEGQPGPRCPPLLPGLPRQAPEGPAP